MTYRMRKRSLIFASLGSIFLILISQTVLGQELPPRPIAVTVNVSQNLAFGAFYHGSSGGSVIIYPDGSRSSTGDIILLGLGYSFSAGLYDVTGNAGTLISILNGVNATLTGSNGGSMTLSLGDTNPLSPFILNIIYPSTMQFTIGATLHVGNNLANPPGQYTGTFDVTFIQE